MARYSNYNYDQSKLRAFNFFEQILPGRSEYTVYYLVDKQQDLSVFDSQYRIYSLGGRSTA
jgi:hypothetical protein